MEIQLNYPYHRETFEKLRAGDMVTFTGVVYTARDAAHKRMMEELAAGKPMPFDVSGQVIYYAGPTPTRPGTVIGSCGPTTSGRMDKFTPKLLDLGLLGMVGKGFRSPEVIASMVKNKAVYFGAIGGAGALIARSVKKAEEIAYLDLGPESIKRLEVENFPAIVVIDSQGNNLYEKAGILAE